MSRRHQEGSGVEVTLPITQFLDMAFQLLFFFMATFNPSPIEGEMDLALPNEKPEAKANNPAMIDRTKQAIKEFDDLVFDLSVEIQSLTVDDPASQDPFGITLVEGPVRTQIIDPDNKRGGSVRILREKLSKKWKDREEGITEKAKAIEPKEREDWTRKELAKQGVKIIGNKDLRWEYILKILDVVNKSGWKTTTIAAPNDYRLSAVD